MRYRLPLADIQSHNYILVAGVIGAHIIKINISGISTIGSDLKNKIILSQYCNNCNNILGRSVQKFVGVLQRNITLPENPAK
jgi:hypothetical protein